MGMQAREMSLIGQRERGHLERTSTSLSFDPDFSNRERRKLKRKVYTSSRKRAQLYDDTGRLINSSLDVCDCLQPECPGCHMPCPKCHSAMCGHECRVNRKWTYEQVEIEGTDKVLRNRHRS